MKKWIVVSIIIVLLLAVCFFFFYTSPEKIYSPAEKDNSSLGSSNNSGDRQITGHVVGSSEENTSGGSGSTASNENPGVDSGSGLPSDLYTARCGYYYRTYGMCVGTCPLGRCTLDDGSCYCMLGNNSGGE